MNDLVFTRKDEAVTDSLIVAEYFQKRHDRVLRAIENLLDGLLQNNETLLFIKTTYVEEQNGQTYRKYLMTRGGFSLLAMGFTGKKALQWKLKYIEAFSTMEKALTERKNEEGVRTTINDLIVNMDNHDQIIRIIGKAIHEEKYDIACEALTILNDLRMSNSLKPLSTADVLFMNFMYLFPDDEDTKDKRCLYIFKLSDGSVKIGVSNNPEQRIKTLSKQSGKKITAKWYSKPLENAFKIEKDLHGFFSKHRLEGEYFQIDFNDALLAIKDKYDLDVLAAESIYKRYKEVAA